MFAGIGGFDSGFERAGWETKWQVEINPVNRAVLADRFPLARRFEDVKNVKGSDLGYVDCITAGFPCQDISLSGSNLRKQTGLKGERSGLFHEVLRILDEIRPQWVVLENVPALLYTNNRSDIETVIQSLAERDYVGYARVLDAQYFGVPQKRRRIFLVAGLGQSPSLEFLADAGNVESLPYALGTLGRPRAADGWASGTLCTLNTPERFAIGNSIFVAHQNGWHQNLERARAVGVDGIRKGLDEAHLAEAFSAGNAVVPQIAEWIAHILNESK